MLTDREQNSEEHRVPKIYQKSQIYQKSGHSTIESITVTEAF